MTQLDALREEAAGCRACPLWQTATQTVFGEGRSSAHVVLVGEQPGDRKDIEGRPFVGPAGRVLDDALAQAGIDRSSASVTNAVKHFRWTEIAVCRSEWLDRELTLIRPVGSSASAPPPRRRCSGSSSAHEATRQCPATTLADISDDSARMNAGTRARRASATGAPC